MARKTKAPQSNETKAIGYVRVSTDALAVAVVCLEHPTVKLARRMLAA